MEGIVAGIFEACDKRIILKGQKEEKMRDHCGPIYSEALECCVRDETKMS